MLTTVSLADDWRLTWFEPGKGVEAGAQTSDHNDGGWLPVRVPSEVHWDLQKAGIIRGQLFGKTPDEEKWIESAEWWYRLSFVPAESLKLRHLELVFDGLDTLATIYLNGEPIARNESMHVPLRVDVRDCLRWGRRNVLAVRIDPVDRLAEDKSLAGLYTTTTAERLFVRKAQVNFGWDFCGRQVTAGIWQPVRLEAWQANRLETVHLVATPRGDGGELDVRVATRGSGGTVEVSVRPRGARSWAQTQKLRGGKGTLKLDRVKLWWPHTMGEPSLYEVRVRLLDGSGKPLDEQTHRVGFRTIEVVEDPIEDGTRFGFRINGRDTFLCGANWVPPSPYYVDVDEAMYRKLLTYAVRGNLAMLRVWGGGVYELDSFYDLADELGILIWHDFMWACGVYPDGPHEQQLAAAEAKAQIERLRNHPSIACWSGDNEDDWAFQWGQLSIEQRDRYALTRKVLPEAVAHYDPARRYFPSSPFSPNDADCNSSREGDQHQYRWQSLDTEGERSYLSFFKDRSRFVSEFGHTSLPGIETLGIYNFRREEMDVRKRWGTAVRPPNPPDPWHGTITGVQFQHALFQKRVLEHYRRLFPVCSGTLHWKFNDPFSANNFGFGLMASVDPLGRAKMSFYYAKRAYAPIAVSVRKEDDTTYTAWICNGTAGAFRGRLRIDLVHQDNTVRSAVDQEVTVDADASQQAATIDLKAMGFTRWEDYRDNVAAIHLERDGEEVFCDTHWFMDIRREGTLKLIWGELTAKVVERRPERLVVSLRADRYLRPVELLLPRADASYDDNFLDLLPGVERRVTIERWPWDTATDLRNQLLVLRGWNFATVRLDT